MTRPLTQAARDRLRVQVRREQELAAGVIAAELRLSDALAKRDRLVAKQDQIIAAREDAVADSLIAYVDNAGLSVERAAIILGRDRRELARVLRERRASTTR